MQDLSSLNLTNQMGKTKSNGIDESNQQCHCGLLQKQVTSLSRSPEKL